ncbi:MAG: DsbA family protein [Burkholderiaceae bacterium]|nr:DsbA family protein [Burkholderiaceae bacterium]
MIEKNLMVLKMYSDYKSPYAWMAFEPCLDFAREFHVHVRWVPFQLRLKDKGARSDTTEYKVHYSYMDGRRAGNDRGIWIKGPLKIYNTRPALIGGLFAEKHGLLRQYSLEVYRRFFLREFEADLPEPVLDLVESMGMPRAEFEDYLNGQGLLDYERCQQEADADHCFGVPYFLLDGEPFWGHDRLDVLRQTLIDKGLSRNGTATSPVVTSARTTAHA